MSSATRRRLVPTSSPHGLELKATIKPPEFVHPLLTKQKCWFWRYNAVELPGAMCGSVIRLYPDPDITEPDIIEYVLYCTGSFQPCLGKYEHTSSWPQAFGRAVAVLNDT